MYKTIRKTKKIMLWTVFVIAITACSKNDSSETNEPYKWKNATANYIYSNITSGKIKAIKYNDGWHGGDNQIVYIMKDLATYNVYKGTSDSASYYFQDISGDSVIMYIEWSTFNGINQLSISKNKGTGNCSQGNGDFICNHSINLMISE